VKKHLTIALTLLFLFSLIGMPVQAKKAGEIENDIYSDNDFGFSFKVPDKWSVKVKKSKSALRLTMEEKSPVPPQQFQGELRDYMQIPTIKILADTTSLTCEEFVDSLLSPEYDNKQKNFFMKSLNLISKPHEIQKRSNVTFEGANATVLEARQAYTMEVSARGSDRADVINDHKKGAIFFTVRDGNVIIIHMICEYKTSTSLMGVFDALLKSLTFKAEADKPAKEEKG
jgi:hypothetical protein